MVRFALIVPTWTRPSRRAFGAPQDEAVGGAGHNRDRHCEREPKQSRERRATYDLLDRRVALALLAMTIPLKRMV
jgi:hypothetical protein